MRTSGKELGASLLTDFAAKYKLRTKRDECGVPIIPGRFGQIYGYGNGKLAVLCMFESPKRWAFARRRLISVGCTVFQNGDWEGTAVVDFTSDAQAKAAISAIKAKKKRIASKPQLDALSNAGRLHRFCYTRL